MARETGILTLREAERNEIEYALAFHKGNVRPAARDLGIAFATLYRKIKEYQIDLASIRKSK